MDMKQQLIQAAERGNAEVQFNLAIMYENGLVDSRYVAEGNHSEAMRWLLAAAEQGLARAQIKLAEMYGEEPDGSVQACEWYLLAAKGLHGAHLQKARSAYERASLGLTPVQSAEVSRFVRDWTPKVPGIAVTLPPPAAARVST
jgi:TPR repeat protein